MSAFITAIQTAGEVLARAMRQEKEIKVTTLQRKKQSISICQWHHYIHRKSHGIYKKKTNRGNNN